MTRQHAGDMLCAAGAQIKNIPRFGNFDSEFIAVNFRFNNPVAGVIFHRKFKQRAVDVHFAIDHFDIMHGIGNLNLPT